MVELIHYMQQYQPQSINDLQDKCYFLRTNQDILIYQQNFF